MKCAAMKCALSAAALLLSFLVILSGVALAQNPVPFVAQPLVPDAAAPGGPGFTLRVNGTGFVAGSVVNWNGGARATHFVNQDQLTATIPATDIVKAGTASINVINPAPGGGKSGTVFFPIAAPSPFVSLVRSDFSSPGGNIQVVTADFNGDGKLDLATAVYYGSTLRIFLGNGDGTFKAASTYSVCEPDTLATGDFNRDGIMDLVVGARGCNQIIIFLGNGDGTFRQGRSFAAGPGGPWGSPYHIAVGDFNGDGKLDLVTANESNFVSVLLGNGDGTFQSHVDYNVYPVDSTRYIATGDFNGDGHLDLAVCSHHDDGSDNRVAILLGNGDGTFQPPSIYQTEGNFVVAADLNGDGKLDLAVVGAGLSIMLGNGDGTFRIGSHYNSGGVWLIAEDFNGDGILDLVSSNYWGSSVSLLPGNGDGTFRAPVNYPAGNGARGIAVGDFNGDGKLDLAVGNQFVDSISVLLQTSGGPEVTLSQTSLTFAPQSVGTKSASQMVTMFNLGHAPLILNDILDVNNADFLETDNCGPEGGSFGFGGSCNIWVSFRPTQDGTRSGSIKFIDNATNSPQIIKLSGTGVGSAPVANLEPSNPISFAPQKAGTMSTAKTLLLTNIGNAALNLMNIAVSGDFLQINNCPASLAPGAGCKIMVTFKPTVTGTRTGSVTITDNAPGSPQISKLSGTGF